jgi:AcrR family transcriptional regulator
MPESPHPDDRLIDALFGIIAEHGWRGVTVTRLAEASGVAAGVLVRRFPSRLDLLRLHGDRVAEIVAANTVPGQGGNLGGTPRDRLFDVLMRGIDALQPHRAGMKRLITDMFTDAVLSVALGPIFQKAMGRMLDAAEIDSSGPLGRLRAAGLVVVWIRVVNAWSKDETQDLGPTMAALDRALERADQTARSLRLSGGDLAPAPQAAEAS